MPMNRATGLLAIALLVLISTGVAAAQTRADFSGRWTTEPEPIAATAPGQRAGGGGGGAGRGGRGDMGSGWGPTITITQDAAQLTVEYVFFGRGDMQPPLRFRYALDGGETTNSVMMGRGIQTQTSTTKWDGSKLVISTRHTYDDPSTRKPAVLTVTQTVSLESDTSLVVETTRAGALGGPATTTRSVYRKL
jgi:hypothetical protein